MSARGVNKVILIGNLGADPDVRYMPSGDAVANLRIATSETWRDKQTGENRERTEWHNVVIFGKLAEVAKQYLRKGSKVYIEGKLRTRKWQGQDGQDRYTTEVVVDIGGSMQMLDPRGGGGDFADGASGFGGSQRGGGYANVGGGYGEPAPAARGPAPAPARDNAPSGGYEEPPPFDDDIPF